MLKKKKQSAYGYLFKSRQRNFIWLKAARYEQRGKIKLHFSNIGRNNKGNMYLSYNKAVPGQNIRDLPFAT